MSTPLADGFAQLALLAVSRGQAAPMTQIISASWRLCRRESK
jgi:hypothetical protein